MGPRLALPDPALTCPAAHHAPPPNEDSATTTKSNAPGSSHATSTEHPAGGAHDPCGATAAATGTTTHTPCAATANPTSPADHSPATTPDHEPPTATPTPTDSYTAPATNNEETAPVTTNAPHSPTPTNQPTPSSASASSTGPDRVSQVSWPGITAGHSRFRRRSGAARKHALTCDDATPNNLGKPQPPACGGRHPVFFSAATVSVPHGR